MPLPDDPFTRAAFDRRQRLTYDQQGHSAMFIAPEDIVVAKMVAYASTESEKHVQDAQSVLVMQWGELDLDLMRRSAQMADVLGRLEQLLEAAEREIERGP